MTKKSRRRNRNKRPLDLLGLKNGRYAKIDHAEVESKGYPQTGEMFLREISQKLKVVENCCPDNAPCTVIVEFDSPIRIHAVVLASPQGSLLTDTPDGIPSAQDQSKLEETSLAEAEQIAAEAAKKIKGAIDVGVKMAEAAEQRTVPLDEAVETMAASPDERISRYAYGRTRGPKVDIKFNDSRRAVGGGKDIPSTCRSTETFEITNCHLREIKPGQFLLESKSSNDDWLRLRAHTPGIEIVKGMLETPLIQSLQFTATAGIPVDMAVCVTEKISTEERWVEPISLKNKDEVFKQGRDWLNNLEESL